jgi:hypothetical protein
MHECDTLITFTGRSKQQIVADGGSLAWRLNPRRMEYMNYWLGVQNVHTAAEGTHPEAPHGAAFLLGRISGATHVPAALAGGHPDRFRADLREVAELSIPDFWDGKRSSCRYTSLEALGIDPKDPALTWEPVAPVDLDERARANGAAGVWTPAMPVTPAANAAGAISVTEAINDARHTLASQLGIDPAAIEIIIRL